MPTENGLPQKMNWFGFDSRCNWDSSIHHGSAKEILKPETALEIVKFNSTIPPIRLRLGLRMRTFRLTALTFLIAFSFEGFAHAQARRLTSRIVNPDNTLKQPPQPGLQPAPPAAPATTVATPARPATVVTNVVPEKTKEQKAEMVRKTVEFQKKRAEAGAPTAQYDLAMRYLTGDGVEKDPKLGRKWLESAATNGNNQAVKKLSELDKK